MTLQNHLFSVSTLVLLVMAACAQKKNYENPPHYDFKKPEKIFLSDNLNEISGIAFMPGDPHTLLAINDEDGKIYTVSVPDGKDKDYNFGDDGDYEDVAVYGHHAFVLKSNGKLYRVDLPLKDDAKGKRWGKELPDGEYESLFVKGHTLYILCKSCKKSDDDEILGYTCSLKGDQEPDDFDSFHIKPGKDPWPKKGIRPSALAQNPVSGEWFVLSYTSRLLLITDANWQVTGLYPIDLSVFNQPEGIAFDASGNLYISNEGDKITEPNILFFERH